MSSIHSDSKYILTNVATRLLQRLPQISSAKLSSSVVKTLCVSWVVISDAIMSSFVRIYSVNTLVKSNPYYVTAHHHLKLGIEQKTPCVGRVISNNYLPYKTTRELKLHKVQ